MSISAGWYPDPHSSTMLRWWDGSAWTVHLKPTLSAASPSQLPPSAVPQPPEIVPSSVREEVLALQVELEQLRREAGRMRDVVALQEVGVYQYTHPLDDVLAYKARLGAIQDQIAAAIKAGVAVVGTKSWAINGSQKEGAKMVNDFCKLMLRAYNNEVDNSVRTLKPFNLDGAIQRIDKARATIQKLGRAMSIEISEEYHGLRVHEVQLTADFLAKREEEKERAREERARMKEDEIVQREFERENERLEKERAHYESVIAALRARGDELGAATAEAKVAEIDVAIADVEGRAANTRAGYVYCISNVGAFGAGVVKIGLTRRLEPMDRVRELGDASVPFRFDVHALIFSADAVGLETMLHRRFAAKRVNMVNARREFFYATPAEVRGVLDQIQNVLIQFNEVPEALEWRQSETVRARGDVASIETESEPAPDGTGSPEI